MSYKLLKAMRVLDDIIRNNFDEIHIVQIVCDDDCNIVRYNKYAKESFEEKSSFPLEQIPLYKALSPKLLNAMKIKKHTYDAFFVNYKSEVTNIRRLSDVDGCRAYYAEYEPVIDGETGKVLHYFIIKDATDYVGMVYEKSVDSSKFRDLMSTLGMAHIDFMPQEMILDIVGGRDGHNAIGVSLKDPLRNIVHPDDLQRGLSYFKRAAKSTDKPHSTMLRIYSQALKEYREFAFKLFPVKDADGVFWKFSGYCVDMTERLSEIKRHDIKINASINRLRKEKKDIEDTKSRMDDMISMMGHDLRSPLSSILGFSEMMTTVDNREEREELFGFIKKGVEQMSLLVNDILESTRLDAGTMKYNVQSVDVKEVMNDVYSAHLPIFKDLQIELHLSVPESELVIDTDKMRLIEILNNYISNAIKYTKEGSVSLSCIEEDDGCYFHVTDTGAGIAKKDCDRVFDRYEMLGSDVPGTGLGLFICKELAIALGGKVGCTSDKGHGSDFWLWLPIRS